MNSENYQKKLEKFLLKQEERKIKKKNKKRKKKRATKKKIVETTPAPSTMSKKKVGRPKKRGPKKKRIRRKISPKIKQSAIFDFKIVSVLNGKQNGYISKHTDYADAYAALEVLRKTNETIKFPRKFINRAEIIPAKEEYLLLEKNRHGDKADGMLRNEFGKYIKQKITNNKKWIVREKIQKLVEETFWVYGFDPKHDRKTYSWIWDNLVLSKIHNSYDVIRILVYKNKLIIKYDDMPMSMVMCKNGSDCIRMYNAMSDEIKNLKTKQIVPIGAYNIISEKRRELEKEIEELTGWSKMKIQRTTN
jgi:hypothetical protein